jgi:glycosyltransferase involved in cell wall biosynthesis
MRANPPKILHFIDSGGMYGAENVILSLSREMMKHREYEPVIGCIVQEENDPIELHDKAGEYGISAEKIRINNKRFVVDIPLVARRLKKANIAMIHSHGYKPSVAGFLIGSLVDIPVIATCHLWFDDGTRGLKYKIMTRLELAFYKRFPRVISVSPQIQDILEKAGVQKKSLQIIRNGIVVDDYASNHDGERERLRAELGIRENEFVVINVGRLTEQKGQADLVKAAVLLRQGGVSVKFLIVGDGHLKSALEELIETAGLGDRFRLLGFRDDIPSLLKMSDLFILSSLDEGLPMALLEAMAAGIPVVTTPVGYIGHLLRDQENALFVGINDPTKIAAAIESIAGDESLRTALSQSGNRIVRDLHSSEQMYQEYASVYANILHECGKRG